MTPLVIIDEQDSGRRWTTTQVDSIPPRQVFLARLPGIENKYLFYRAQYFLVNLTESTVVNTGKIDHVYDYDPRDAVLTIKK